MNNLGKKIQNAILIAAFILSMLFLAGCGDNEMAKGITDAVKKSVEGEVAKTGQEFRKQFDQVINLGTDKGQKEDGQKATRADKETSDKSSGKKSAEGKD
jgi:outer membrane murein-binding lipoprotein Lpp